MEKEFKEFLKKNGQSLKWFYDEKIKDEIDIGYSGFAGQLNGYAPIGKDTEKIILKFMEE